ncbi:hypothetical protein PWY36_36800, partial [Kribbella solani]|nr:hypothetical protein [Kribbella solani]
MIALKRAATAAAVALTAVLGTVSVSLPAEADVAYNVYGTGGVGLWTHSSPTTSTATRINLLPEGASILIHCQTYGDSVNGSTIWDQLSSGSYVSDWYTNTPNVGTFSPGIGQCGQAPPPPP